jgi:hypothetical protein
MEEDTAEKDRLAEIFVKKQEGKAIMFSYTPYNNYFIVSF